MRILLKSRFCTAVDPKSRTRIYAEPGTEIDLDDAVAAALIARRAAVAAAAPASKPVPAPAPVAREPAPVPAAADAPPKPKTRRKRVAV